MIVECITRPSADRACREVTVGNHYKVVNTTDDDGDGYLLIDDTGYQWWYCVSHFNEIEETDTTSKMERPRIFDYLENKKLDERFIMYNYHYDVESYIDYLEDKLTKKQK